MIMVLGAVAFSFSTAGGVIFAKLLNLVLHRFPGGLAKAMELDGLRTAARRVKVNEVVVLRPLEEGDSRTRHARVVHFRHTEGGGSKKRRSILARGEHEEDPGRGAQKLRSSLGFESPSGPPDRNDGQEEDPHGQGRALRQFERQGDERGDAGGQRDGAGELAPAEPRSARTG
jgi:hypothetical protein